MLCVLLSCPANRDSYSFPVSNMATTTASEEAQAQNEPLFTGSCFCRAVSFTLSDLPTKAYLCHCLDCRRFSASSFAYNASFARSALKLALTKPQEVVFASPPSMDAGKRRYDTGDAEVGGAERRGNNAEGARDGVLSTFGDETTGMLKFCSICGTRLLLYCGNSNDSMRDQVIVPVGAIDGSERDERLRPVAEGWCRRREEWMPDMRGTEVFQ